MKQLKLNLGGTRMATTSAAQRQREYEQRLRDDGYRRLQLWVRESDVAQVKLFCASLSK